MRRGTGRAAAAAASGLGLPAQAAMVAPAGNPARVPAGTALINVAAGSTRWLAGTANQDSSTTLQGIAFDIATGAVNGYMYLLGSGHGVSLGVQPASGGKPAYVWTEAGSGRSGYGQEFVRFPFVAKTLLWTSHPSVQRFGSPAPAATATAGTGALPAPLARIQQPPLYKHKADGTPDPTTPATFQGFTSYSQYAYMLSGDARTSTPSSTLTGLDKWAIHTTSFDLNGTQNGPATGYIASIHSEADPTADPREPEGMAIHTGAGAPRLCFGITNNSGSNRQFDLYYKV
ncbi:hypothetical protein ACFWWA_34550 [Streptomyces goshikiensis]|uniref:hypothetical protein n=1 Tax=Streptomyces goshikiensis TaxID=1942 RepID=UPI0036497DEA